ncbi:hypothetical protein M422DRAFT_182846, partial [Sphaerobolus stellatus SS14]
VTTDSSKVRFGGMLSQQLKSKDKNGKLTQCWHPITYCSKHTSTKNIMSCSYWSLQH